MAAVLAVFFTPDMKYLVVVLQMIVFITLPTLLPSTIRAFILEK